MLRSRTGFHWLQGLLAASLIALAVSCDSPRQERAAPGLISNGTLRVGIIGNPPWAYLNRGEPAGVEVELLRTLAQQLDSRVEWSSGPESELLSALKHGQLDVVIGGLTRSNPWTRELAATYAYHHSHIVVAQTPYAPPLRSVSNAPVLVRAGSSASGHLARKGGKPITVQHIAYVEDYVALPEWELPRYNLQDTGITLHSQQHVMLVGQGESEWLMLLESFLRQQESQLEQLLADAAAAAG